MLFVRAYPRETQEMVFDAHDRAFALFKGTCRRGIYDNMKTAVETIFVGKQRLYNRRFLQMCSHHLVEPVACTPASGWEKGPFDKLRIRGREPGRQSARPAVPPQAERIVVLFDDEAVADHPRQFRRDQIIYDPWHYLPVLVKKPGALRNGAPFKDWDLPPGLTEVRTKLKQHADGDRQFVKVLGAVLDHGLAAV